MKTKSTLLIDPTAGGLPSVRALVVSQSVAHSPTQIPSLYRFPFVDENTKLNVQDIKPLKPRLTMMTLMQPISSLPSMFPRNSTSDKLKVPLGNGTTSIASSTKPSAAPFQAETPLKCCSYLYSSISSDQPRSTSNQYYNQTLSSTEVRLVRAIGRSGSSRSSRRSKSKRHHGFIFATPKVLNVRPAAAAAASISRCDKMLNVSPIESYQTPLDGLNTFTSTSMEHTLHMPIEKRGRKPKTKFAGNMCFVSHEFRLRQKKTATKV
ncbi:hypothetical protein DFQ30_002652 [Apophysomyces sp. BC1015]|nr:hypothetical protein DFQ30_002652 [Apophysomyces sp. BC1015]